MKSKILTVLSICLFCVCMFTSYMWYKTKKETSYVYLYRQGCVLKIPIKKPKKVTSSEKKKPIVVNQNKAELNSDEVDNIARAVGALTFWLIILAIVWKRRKAKKEKEAIQKSLQEFSEKYFL